ncbi:MAG TPA: endonuclease NucS domain-containing protein [Candidatus Sulfotelmatobacter sp.]|nr:endonuclease NucS domain-containing protein [Candidatus Sulfotelmatobacter sp.]
MNLWKINCEENKFPGMWQRWFKHQCVAVGWPPDWFCLEGHTKDYGWSRARNAMQRIQTDDVLVVTLPKNRIARIGYVTRKEIRDNEWKELVPRSREHPAGQIGRRILVRWDLTIGPDSRDQVVRIPDKYLSNGEQRPTLCLIQSHKLEQLKEVMNDPVNWVNLDSNFAYERALQEYIAAYPHHLEDGLLPHPDIKIREKVLKDRSRLDVLLIDPDDSPVIVECKRDAPATLHVSQLRNYMHRLQSETGRKPRGILVHNGARKLSEKVRKEAAKRPRIEIVRYALNVNFDRCA